MKRPTAVALSIVGAAVVLALAGVGITAIIVLRKPAPQATQAQPAAVQHAAPAPAPVAAQTNLPPINVVVNVLTQGGSAVQKQEQTQDQKQAQKQEQEQRQEQIVPAPVVNPALAPQGVTFNGKQLPKALFENLAGLDVVAAKPGQSIAQRLRTFAWNTVVSWAGSALASPVYTAVAFGGMYFVIRVLSTSLGYSIAIGVADWLTNGTASAIINGGAMSIRVLREFTVSACAGITYAMQTAAATVLGMFTGWDAKALESGSGSWIERWMSWLGLSPKMAPATLGGPPPVHVVDTVATPSSAPVLMSAAPPPASQISPEAAKLGEQIATQLLEDPAAAKIFELPANTTCPVEDPTTYAGLAAGITQVSPGNTAASAPEATIAQTVSTTTASQVPASGVPKSTTIDADDVNGTCSLPYMSTSTQRPQSTNQNYKPPAQLPQTTAPETNGTCSLPYMSTSTPQPQSPNPNYKPPAQPPQTTAPETLASVSQGGAVGIGSILGTSALSSSTTAPLSQPTNASQPMRTGTGATQWETVAEGESVVQSTPQPVTIEALERDRQVEVIGIGVDSDNPLTTSVAPLPSSGVPHSAGWWDALSSFRSSGAGLWSWLQGVFTGVSGTRLSSVVRVGGRIALVRVMQTPAGQQVVVSLLTSLVPGVNTITAVTTLNAVWTLLSLNKLGWSLYQTIAVDSATSAEEAMRYGIDMVVTSLNSWDLMNALGASVFETGIKVL